MKKLMRFCPLRSIPSWTLAWIATLSFAAPMAGAQDDIARAEARRAVPLAAVRGEERCKLVVVQQGESAELIEERTSEQGQEFPFLRSQEVLNEEFRVRDDRWTDCAIAFGLQPGGGVQAASAGLAGAPVAAGAITVPVTAGVLGGIVVVAGAAVLLSNPTAATSTE